LFVADGNQVVAFDPISSEAAATFASEIKRIVPRAHLAGIVYSHSDADHSTGATTLMAAFEREDVPIVAHELASAPIRERADPDQPEPTVTFAERLMFHVGDRRVELHYLGPSHTDNIAVGFIPDVRVAFAVDFVNNDRTGYRELPRWHFPEFFDALARMLDIPFEIVVFGHGEPGGRGAIQRQIAYYDDLRSAVRRGIEAGMTEDELAESIELPAYAGFGRYKEWMPLNARAIYRWQQGEQ
jgi:glyoxylase-like metal-dependent hydrolase (beta-lactamase superfamily II)